MNLPPKAAVMNFWQRNPFVRIALPFTAGILLAFYGKPGRWEVMLFFAAPFSVLFLLQVLPITLKRRTATLRAILIQASLTGLGGLVMNTHQPSTSADFFARSYEKGDTLLASVDQWPEPTGAGHKTILTITGTLDSNRIEPRSGKCWAWFRGNLKDSLWPGTTIALHAELERIPPPKTDTAFNFRAYMAKQGVRHRVFIDSAQYRVIQKANGTLSHFLNPYLKWRLEAQRILQAHAPDKNTLAIANAMLTGDRSLLDKELRQRYADAGAIHILAVSGLHTGIVYLFLASLLKPLGKKRAGRILKGVLLIAGLWSYAAFTGFSPSVSRSATMFSFLAIGQAHDRKAEPMNAIAASAFFLLLIDPYLLFQPGFQFSYLAVTSIVLFHPALHTLFYIPWKLADKAWTLTSVSISAQIGVFPIALYYFEQFPNYFIITNLAAIPLAAAILYSGGAAMVLKATADLSIPLTTLFYPLVQLKVGIVEAIAELPGAVTEGRVTSIPEILLIQATCFSYFIFYKRRRIEWLRYTLMALCGVLLVRLF